MERQESSRLSRGACSTCGGGWCPDHLFCRQDAAAINRMKACLDCDEDGVQR